MLTGAGSEGLRLFRTLSTHHEWWQGVLPCLYVLSCLLTESSVQVVTSRGAGCDVSARFGAVSTGRETEGMTSLRHRALAFALPRVLGATEMEDEAQERAAVIARHRAKEQAGAMGLPTSAVPGFARRFDVVEETLTGPNGVAFASYVITAKDSQRRAAPTSTLFYVHGGAFISPMDRFHVRYVTRLATALGLRVILPQYPLAPEHTWRDSVEPLSESVADWTSRSPGGLILSGDSAGGGLALAVAMGVRDKGGPQPTRLLLHAPWGDLTTSTPATKDYAKIDNWLKYSKLIAYAGWWAGSGADLGRPEVSPTLANLDGLPPGLVLAGTRDLLLPGCRLLADRAAESTWDLTYMERPGLVHVFSIMPLIPEAKQAFDYSVGYLRSAGFGG